jgi:O-antigen ligase
MAIWIGIDPVVSRFELVPEEWEAEQGRSQVWMDSLEAAGDYWLTGSGLSSFRYVYPGYRSFGGRVFYSWAHNDYLQALIELGVPGFLLILWIMAGVWNGARHVRHRLSGNLPLLHLHAGYCAAAVAVALHSFTDFGLHLAANGALLAVIVGVVLGMGGGRKR